jgi:beta-lactamase regulating signal transducer with metallopeptidase domain
MSKIFINILNMSTTASFIAFFVIAIRLLLKKTPKIYSYALWAAVFFRLVCPFTLKLPFNLNPINTKTIPSDIIYVQTPKIDSGITFINEAVNGAIENSFLPAEPANSANPIQVLLELGSYLWMIVFLILLVVGFINYLGLKNKVKDAILVKDNIFETDQIDIAFVLGIIKPKIYIPTSSIEPELGYILEHEKIHIKRLDYLVKPLAFLITAVHWFNPIAWLSYMLMARDMEFSVDEQVIKGTKTDIRVAYSTSLYRMATKNNKLLSPLAFGEAGVKVRIKNILNYKKPVFWISTIAAVITITVIISLSFTGADKGDNYNVHPDKINSTNSTPAEASYKNKIEELIETLVSSPDDKAVWRRPKEAIEIAEMGDNALDHFFSVFEKGIESESLRGKIIMDLCRDMLSKEDINLITDRPEYWYEMFKAHVLRLRGLNTSTDMALKYPKSSILLTILEIPEDAPTVLPPTVKASDYKVFDATKPLTDNEFTLFNGVKLGMSMSEVLAIIGEDVEFYEPAFPENQGFAHDGIFYGCYRAEGEDTFILISVGFNDSKQPAIRDIRIGDTIESVFDKFPVRDKELKKWAWQMLYGYMPEEGQPHKNYAALEFVADSYYSMRVLAENYGMTISFSRVEQKVIMLSIGRLS